MNKDRVKTPIELNKGLSFFQTIMVCAFSITNVILFFCLPLPKVFFLHCPPISFTGFEIGLSLLTLIVLLNQLWALHWMLCPFILGLFS